MGFLLVIVLISFRCFVIEKHVIVKEIFVDEFFYFGGRSMKKQS